MNFKELFDAVRRHVEQCGVACTTAAGKSVTTKALAKTEAKMGIKLPADVRDFYQVVGDGFRLHWNAGTDEVVLPFANVEFPTLSELAHEYISWKGTLYSPKQAEEYGFHGTEDPVLAKRTAARMWHWFPVLNEGNGDYFCLDLSDPGCPVVFDLHSWIDGGSGANGHPLAPNWRSFLTAWGSVCFQFPKDLYWPFCFQLGGGVNWNGDQFREPFRR